MYIKCFDILQPCKINTTMTCTWHTSKLRLEHSRETPRWEMKTHRPNPAHMCLAISPYLHEAEAAGLLRSGMHVNPSHRIALPGDAGW